MEKDTEKTVVIFRKWKKQYSQYEDIIAIFPNEKYDDLGNCLSYEHIGQHGGAYYPTTISATVPATPDEYKDLKKELESLGYNLKIQKRWMRR